MEKKKMKLWKKIAFTVLAAVIIIPTVGVIVNASIINDIIVSQRKTINEQNFSYTVQANSAENITTKIYYKDGTKMYVIQNNDRNMIMWKSQSTDEMINVVPTALKATISKCDEDETANIPYLIDEQTSKTMKLSSIITSEKVNGEDCYKVNNLGLILWYSKSTGMIVKAMNGTMTTDGKETACVTEFKDWKFNELTDTDMTRPNLTGYKVTNNA